MHLKSRHLFILLTSLCDQILWSIENKEITDYHTQFLDPGYNNGKGRRSWEIQNIEHSQKAPNNENTYEHI